GPVAKPFPSPGQNFRRWLLGELAVQFSHFPRRQRREWMAGWDRGGDRHAPVLSAPDPAAGASLSRTRSEKSPNRSPPFRSLAKRSKSGRSSLTKSSVFTLSL